MNGERERWVRKENVKCWLARIDMGRLGEI